MGKKDSSIWIDLYRHKASRIGKKQKYLMQFLTPRQNTLLELFSGTGHNIEALKTLNPQAACFGIDYDFNLCKVSKEAGFLSVTGDCEDLPFKNKAFDLIYSNSFHHISKSAGAVFNKSLDLLKPGGLLVGIEPYGFTAALLSGIIYFMPDFLISLFPVKFRCYLGALKYECKDEATIRWYYKYSYGFKRELSKYPLISMHRDLLSMYYCIKK